MRHRVTILNHQDSHDSLINLVSPSRLVLNDISYTREDKYTISVKEFMNHVKWLRITVGSLESNVFHYNSNHLNIYAVPHTKNQAKFFFELNGFVNRVFGIKVAASDWIRSKDSLMLHQHHFQLGKFHRLMSELSGSSINPDVVDFAYERKPADHQVVFSFINTDHLPITYTPEVYTEVGLFLVDPNSSNDDIIMAGSRVIMGAPENEFMVKTLFHIKPKYRGVSSAAHDIVSNGMHPVLRTALDSSPEDMDNDVTGCKLYYYLQLDKSLFIDKYNLGSNFELIVNLGLNDLELPEYKVPEWGNEILLEIPDAAKPIELNLHSRYQRPGSSATSSKKIGLDSPRVFYGCEDVSDRNILSYNPFLNDFAIKANYEKFFTNNTIFYEAFPTPNQLLVDIPVPRAKFQTVNGITSLSIVIGIMIIILQIFKVFLFKSTTSSNTTKKTQ